MPLWEATKVQNFNQRIGNVQMANSVNPDNAAYLKFSQMLMFQLILTVKPVLSGHSKIDKTNILMTNGSLMKVESITECSPSAILLTYIKQ